MWETKFRTHSKKKEQKYILYILIFMCLDSKLEDKRFFTEW